MENLVPLLVVAAVVYRIYSEYRKEQEKAQRRAIRKPAVPQPQDMPPFPFPEIDDMPEPWHPVSVRKEPRASAIVPKEAKKAAQKEKEHKKDVLVAPRPEKPDFDLREAVIQSVILERRF